jgi:DNA-binding LacI/PurR family transcriptional regulator
VTYDDELGAATATRYLIQQGHRRIAHIHGDMRFASAQGRLRGYRKALEDAGLPVDERLIRGSMWAMADGVTATQQLLALDEPPTAIFAANDRLAMAALAILREQGYEVPRNMAVIGFDDIQATEQGYPPLTTIHIPLVDIGRRAAALVVEGDLDDAETILLPVELVLRATA